MPVTTIADLLSLLTREPGRPRITWYGDGGERVELSGAVLENWVNKTANLLVEEFDAGPGTRVRLDLPGHWRTLVWALSAWRVGACVVVGGASATDLVVTDAPDHWASAPEVVAVSLPALARTYDGTLPPGSIDAAAAVMTYGDQLGWAPTVPDDAPALDARIVASHGDLMTVAAARVAQEPLGGRVLSAAQERGRADEICDAIGRLAGNGSVVLVSGRLAEELLDDADRRSRLVGSERVTADLLRSSPRDPGTPTE